MCHVKQMQVNVITLIQLRLPLLRLLHLLVTRATEVRMMMTMMPRIPILVVPGVIQVMEGLSRIPYQGQHRSPIIVQMVMYVRMTGLRIMLTIAKLVI
jgi:hypothetical protein